MACPQNLAIAPSAVTASVRTLRILRRASWHCVRPWRIAVAAPIVLNLVLLAPQLQSVANVNDSNLHLAMIRWAQRQIATGHVPLDGWFPNFSLGASQFHHYQSLPAILTAYLSGPLGAEPTYLLSVYLLLSFWPVSVYWGARLMGRSRGEASIAALLSPLLMSAPGFGFEASSYVWQGYGLWTQLWGAWLLPLALGLTWRALHNHGRSVGPSIVIALTIGCAFITGYMALVAVGAFAIVVRKRWWSRMLRAAIIAGGAALIASWVLMPLVSDQAFQPGPGLASFVDVKAIYDSYGIQQVLTWLINGQLFDNGHLPVISVLAGVGATACIRNWRRDTAGRGILVLALLSLLLFIGPNSVPLLKLLPGSSALQFSRFIGIVQLTALLLAGIGGQWALFWAQRGIVWTKGRLPFLIRVPGQVVPVVLLAVSIAIVFSPTSALINYQTTTNALIAYQAAADASSNATLAPLLTEVAQLDHGRVYAGSTFKRVGTGNIGYVPMSEVLSNHDIDAVGYTGRVQSLSEGAEYFFDSANLVDYQAFAVRYLILTKGSPPPFAATQLDSESNEVLWEIAGVPPGYVRVVDTVAPAIVTDSENLGSVSQTVMQSSDFQQGLFQPVAFAGMPAATPTLPGGAATGSPGSVSEETDNLDNGEVHATVTTSRPAVALLSASYDNRWTASVDGMPTSTQMIAPTLTGVAVSAGTHTVEFRYAPYSWYWLWFLVAITTIAALFCERRLWNFGRTYR